MDNLNEEIDALLEFSLDEAPSRIGSLNVRDFLKFKSKKKIDREKARKKAKEKEAADAAQSEKEKKEKEDKEASDRRKEAMAKMRAQYRATSPQRVRNNPDRQNCGDFIEYRAEELKEKGLRDDIAREEARDEAIRLGCKDTVRENKQSTDELVSIVIDLEELKNNKLNESFLSMFGGWVEHLLGAMFGVRSPSVSVRGSRRDVESFAKTIGSEKTYIEAAKRYGLDHPTTYKNKAKLDASIKGFERDTGLKWPFK